MISFAARHAPPVTHTTAHYLNGTRGIQIVAVVAIATIIAIIYAWTRSKPWAALITAYAIAAIAYVYREPAFTHNTPQGHLVAVGLLWLPALAGALLVRPRSRRRSTGGAGAYSYGPRR